MNMKKLFFLICMMMFCPQLYAEEEQGKPKPQTRSLSVQEAFPLDSLETSPLLRPLDGLGREQVQQAYRDLKATADSIAEADSLSTGFFATNWRYVKQFFVDARQGPEKAMSLLVAVALVLLIIIIVPYVVITFLIPPSFKKVEKPDNAPGLKAEDDEDNNEEEDEEEEEDEDEENEENMDDEDEEKDDDDDEEEVRDGEGDSK